jgi:two-component system CheB/CheR fusion protein
MSFPLPPRPVSAAELRESHGRYRELLSRMSEGLVILNPRFEVVEINAEGLRLDGRPESEILGRSHWELWPRSKGSEIEAAYRKVMSERVAVEFKHSYHHDGEEGCLHVRAYPVADGIAVLYRDITEMERTEQARRQGEERFRAAIAAIGVLWTNNADGQMVGEQPGWAKLTGQGFDDYQGLGWARAVHPDDVEPTLQAWREAVRERRTFVHEHRVRRHDGQWRRFAIRAVPIFEGDGRVREWVGVHIDVTEAAEAAEALHAADRRKDEFVATLAHELRNPLAPIRTAAHLLGRANISPERLAWCGELIRRQSQTMALLLDDLLDVARITSGRLELRRAYVSPASVAASAVETARPLIDSKQHRLEIDVPEDLPLLDVDPLRVAQILTNLLTNAAKYTDPHGLIHIGAHALVDGQVEFEVRDNGVGIAPDVLPSIFEMFRQVQTTMDRSEGGLGIGLALTRGLVQLHGGSIEAHSDGLGRGSRFTVRLPVAQEAPHRAERRSPSRATGAPPPERRTVLVADDNVDAAKALGMMLELEGYDVHVAHDGLHAFDLAQRLQPNAALLDIGMPGLNGYEVATRIRQQAWGDDVALAATTGWGQEEDQRRAMAAGFDWHLTKPVNPAQVLSWLRRRLSTPNDAA